MTKKSVIKAQRKLLALAIEPITKSIRRHNGTKTAISKWGKMMGKLRQIHFEIKPKLEARQSAEEFVFHATIGRPTK